MLVFFLSALALIILLALMVVPELQVRHLRGALEPGDLFDKKNEARSTLAQVVGGLALLVTIYCSIQTQVASERTQRNANDQLVLTREGQLSDRFTKAVQQLADQDPLVRIGGLLALEKAAQVDPKQYHWTAVEVITEFVRHAAAHDTTPACKNDEGPSKDVYIALRIMGRRAVSNDPPDHAQNRLYLGGLDLCGAYLSRLNLSYAEFEWSSLGNARFRETDLSHAWFEESDLRGAFFQSANLSGADFSDANLSHAELPLANLKGAVLTGADLNGTCLDGADLSSAKVTQAQLDMAIGNDMTKLPAGLSELASWKKLRTACVVP